MNGGFSQEQLRQLEEMFSRYGNGPIGGYSGRGMAQMKQDWGDFLELARKISDELNVTGTYFNEMASRSKKLRTVLEGAKEAYDTSKAAEDKYNDSVNKATESMGEGAAKKLDKKLRDVLNRIKEIKSRATLSANLHEISRECGIGVDKATELFDELEETDKKLGDVKASVGGVTTALGTAAMAAGRVRDAVVSIEYGLRSVGAEVKRVANRWIEFQDRAFKNARAMGKDRAESVAYFERSLQYTRELGRRYGLTHEQIVKFQTDYTEATGKSIDLTKKQTESIAAMGTLSSPETASKMADEMDRFGGSIEDAAFYMQLTQERAKILGLNPKKAAESIAQNMKLASTYTFKNGIDGMARMAIEAQRLRVSLEGVVRATENFDDIEKAISNSARIQMLGGSFAANYSNPMGVLYESLNDPEAFMKRMEKTLAGKGVFNRATGQVDVAAIDRRFIKEYAAAAGISFEEAMNMTQSLAKNKEVEAALKANKATSNFTNAQTAFIQSQAQWDAETQQFKVTDQTTGEQIALKDLTAEKLQELQGNTLGEKEMWGDVRAIRQHLLKDIKARQLQRASETQSLKENIQGFKEARDATYAKAINGIMKRIAGSLNSGLLAKLADIFTAVLPPLLAFGLGVAGKFAYRAATSYAMRQGFSLRGMLGWGAKKLGFDTSALGGRFGGGARAGFGGMGGGGAASARSSFSASAGGPTAAQYDKFTRFDRLNAAHKEAFARSHPEFAREYNAWRRAGRPSATASYASNAGAAPGSAASRTASAGRPSPASTARSASRVSGLSKLGRISKVGGALAAAFAGLEIFNAISQHSDAEKAIKSSEMSEEQKEKEMRRADNKRQDSIASAIGAGIGGTIGAALGAGVFSIATGAVGAWLGGKIGGGISRLFGDSRTEDQETKAYAQHNFETEKMGVTGNEPLEDIQYKAAVATIGIHDLMITNYNRAKGLREDGTRKGFWERIDGWFGGDEFANGGIVKPLHAVNGAIIPGEHTIGDHVPVMANSGEMILNKSQQSALFSSIKGLAVKGPEIRPLSSIGQATNFSSAQSTSAASSAPTGGVSDINLNVSGTIRLEGGGNSANLDINSLLNSPQFKRQITDLITNRLNESSNGGKKNLESYRNNMAGQYNKVGR